MADMRFTMIGDKELSNTLKALSNSVSNSIMRPAVSEGLKPIQKQAKDNCPKDTGTMKRAIKTKVKTGKVKVSGRVFVDRKTSTDKNGKKYIPGYVAHMVEFGSKVAAPHPFMRPALDGKKAEALSIITNKAKSLLPSAVAKAKSKGKAVWK